MSSQEAQAEFESKHPQPQKLFIGSTSTNWSMKQFWDQRAQGGTQSIICYTPPGVDAVRWNLGRYWAPDGTLYDKYETQLANGTRVGSISGSPLWVLGNGGHQGILGPFVGKAGTDDSFTSFPFSPKPSKEYKWNDLSTGCDGCHIKDERKETLVVGKGGDNWGVVTTNKWIWTVDSHQITGNPFEFNGVPLASAFGTDGVKGKVFYDHAFELELPFSKEQIGERSFGSVRQMYADIKPVYNFYVQSYETKISESNVYERMLPNMYAFLLVQQEKDPEDVILLDDPTTVDDIFEKHVTLNNTMGNTMYTVNRSGLPFTRDVLNQKGEMTFQKSSKGQYYDKWAKSYDEFYESWPSGPAGQTAQRFLQLVVPMSDLKLYRDFNSKRTQFPMYVDISFSTDVTKTFFADALQKSQLSSVFTKDVITSQHKFKPKEFTGVHSDVIIPHSFAYRSGDSGPAVLVWWGRRYGGVRSADFQYANQTLTPHWGTEGGMWTNVTNIEHQDANLAGHSFRIGDWVKVKNGAWWGNSYHPDQHAQVIGYATKSKYHGHDVGRNYQGVWSHWWRDVNDFVDDSSAQFYPRTTEFDETLRGQTARQSVSHQAFALYTENDDIPTSRYQPNLERDFRMTNTTKKETIISKFNEWDITSWFKDFISAPIDSYTTGSNGMVFLGQYNEDIAEAEEGSGFYKTLMSIIFAGKFDKLIKQKTRSYQQILLGKQAHSETVFYKVEKWHVLPNGTFQGLGGRDIPLQSIYFPNSSDVDVHRYIDTQVKYNKRYGYRVYAMVAVFGTRYRYSLNGITGTEPPPTTPNPRLNNDPFKAEICVFTSPSVRLIQVPYYQFIGRVMDAPPIWPDVNVIQYKNHNNKVLFFFKGNVGNYKLKPIPIELNDYEDIFDLAEAQRLRGNDPMEYRSDDQAAVFEIFRMTEKPMSYADFEDHKLTEVETDTFDDPKKTATAAAFVDNIVPNQKYYYIFRTVDNHGHTSNPTPIYQIEIIDHDGGAVLTTKVFQLVKEKEPPQVPAKKAKKYIYITPNSEQLEVNKNRNALVNPTTGENVGQVPPGVITEGAQLGISEEVVWGKKYKIRVSSKKTGRKIDFNIQCQTKPWVTTDQDR